MNDKIAQAAANWIRAEWYFRLGPMAYQDRVTAQMIAAEEALREAVTGEPDLHHAAVKLITTTKLRVVPVKNKWVFSKAYRKARRLKAMRHQKD